MPPMLYLVIGIVVGFAVGFGIAFMKMKTATAAWEERLADARGKLATLQHDSGAALEHERSRAADGERRATEKGEKLATVEKGLEQHRSQLKQTQGQLAEVEAARAKAAAQSDANANARQQAEGRAKQAEGLAQQAQRALEAAQAQVQTALSEAATLKDTSERRGKEVQKLRQDLAQAKQASSSGLDESVEVFAECDGSLEGILRVLLETQGQKAAVLADATGSIVAAVGEQTLKEGMAAASQIVGSICTQLVDMVPFSSVRSYALHDTQSNVIAGRTFVCQGEMIGIATYGQRAPSERVLDGAVANLNAALE